MNKVFTMEELPQAYLGENENSKKLRRKFFVRNLNHENDITEDYLSQHFYSKENIEIINKMLVLKVFKESNLKIGFQSENDLKVVMTWVYVHYAKNLPFKIKEQIRELNEEVVNQLKDSIISNTRQHMDYIRDITEPRVPLPPPQNVSRDKTLPSISEIFHGR